MGRLVGHVGPIRDTNFGPVWSVRLKPDPDSTAYTGLDLGQHTDLPTREVPPGFQFLHCIENTVAGGWSRMSDGWAVVEAIRAEHPDAYEALTTLEWVFMNRAQDAEHRWIGPIIDHGGVTPAAHAAGVLPGPQRAPHGARRHPARLRIAAGVRRDGPRSALPGRPTRSGPATWSGSTTAASCTAATPSRAAARATCEAVTPTTTTCTHASGCCAAADAEQLPNPPPKSPPSHHPEVPA